MNMDNILYLDIEADTDSRKINEIGVLYRSRALKDSSPKTILSFIKLCYQAEYICGHNIYEYDLPLLKEKLFLYQEISRLKVIDTLPLSLLLFSQKSIHALPKNYKDEDNFLNDPLKDCQLTQKLLDKIISQFQSLPSNLQSIFASLLHTQDIFRGFFEYISYEAYDRDRVIKEIQNEYAQAIVNMEYLEEMVDKYPIELAYIISLLTPTIEIKSHPPKILYDYPDIVEKQKRLCFDLDNIKTNLSSISEDIFGFKDFRSFDRLNPTILESPQISQRDIIEASLNQESFLAILPTGGGKTFTFWLPAVIQASKYKSLTVVISPLQALIEDHIKSFEAKVANYKAVAISGFMTPQARAEAIDSVINGTADILYIAPESLRSNTIFHILKNRYIERFVIDEAHCLSTWGNDFRQDYYYIAEFIQDLLKAKRDFQKSIPISCFTATAKLSVIDDIKNYFQDKLSIDMREYLAKPSRTNLKFYAYKPTKEQKYTTLLKLIQEHNGSTLVYIPTSTKLCDEIAKRLSIDTPKSIRSFHSKIDSQEKMKILKDYIDGEIDVIIATTAFGMGVDKPDITQVIHYEPSDSLENYSQEAGRGAREQSLEAICPVIYNEADLDKHFNTLRRNRIGIDEINSIFRVIKQHKSDTIKMSAKELAKAAGWDIEDESKNIETKVKTILLELEREGYIRRRRNIVRFFGDSIAYNSREKLQKFLEKRGIKDDDRWLYIEILNRILGNGKDKSIEIDDISNILGVEREKVALILEELRDEGIIGDSKDTVVELLIKDRDELDILLEIEAFLFLYLKNNKSDIITIKELNEILLIEKLIEDNSMDLIKEIIKGWRSKNLFVFSRINRQQDKWIYRFEDSNKFEKFLTKRRELLSEIIDIFLKERDSDNRVEFSLKELKEKLNNRYTLKEIDKGLLFLHRYKLISLLGGRFIYYNPLVIEKMDKIKIKNKRYTKSDYSKRLGTHYRVKTEAIHIMGVYIELLLNDSLKAKEFLSDYFTMNYDKFKRRYKLLKDTITRPITKYRYENIFQKLNEQQKLIIDDKDSRAIMILAGPGSGKTRVLVHKIASMVLIEDVKPEYFMMLTFSRSAVREFKSRLHKLIDDSVYDMEISTFHSFALKIIGRTADNIYLDGVIPEATRQIRNNITQIPHLKALVLDEYQDISDEAFELISAIVEVNSDIRIVAVGDDDQTIMDFSGANLENFKKFEERFSQLDTDDSKSSFKKYELITNYRSTANIVNYSQEFISRVENRFKERALEYIKDSGSRVNVIRYQGNHWEVEAIKEAKRYLKDSNDIAILAYTNDEVLELYSRLKSENIPVRYLINRPRFELKNIEEVIKFDEILNSFIKFEKEYKKEYFEEALNRVENLYKGSKNLPLLKKIVYRFLDEADNLAISFWLQYLDEIELEMFEESKGKVTVSTIHKSKGLEFDTVILLAKNSIESDVESRLYYVGMTRAKENLTIFHNDNSSFLLSNHYADYLDRYDKVDKAEDIAIVLVMSLSDINLGYEGKQNIDKDFKIIAGEELEFKRNYNNYNKYEIFYKGFKVEEVSKNFQKRLNSLENRGYEISRAIVDFVVHWYDSYNDRYIKHILAQIELK